MANPRSPGKTRPGRRSRVDNDLPTLPAWKAFVVQFTRETGVEPETFCGRVEHLSSGQSSRFDSAGGLIEFVQAVLQQPGSTRR